MKRANLGIIIAFGFAVAMTTQSGYGVTKSWTGSSADDYWSTPSNWSGGPPANGDDAVLTIVDGMGIADLATNMVVDAGFTGVIRSLKFGQTNCLHRMEVAAPQLNIQGNAASPLFVGSGADDGGTAKNYTTITGKSLVIDDPGGDMIVRQGSATSGSHYTLLNMSDLDTFTANINRLLISYEDDSQNQNRRPGAWVFMARTNYITCNYPGLGYQIGHVVQQAGLAATNRLGQVNVFNVRSMRFGGAKTANTTVNFNSGYTDPSAKFRGIDGVGRQTAWYIVPGVKRK